MCVEEGVIIVSSDKMGGHIRAPYRQVLRLKATGFALSSSTSAMGNLNMALSFLGSRLLFSDEPPAASDLTDGRSR